MEEAELKKHKWKERFKRVVTITGLTLAFNMGNVALEEYDTSQSLEANTDEIVSVEFVKSYFEQVDPKEIFRDILTVIFITSVNITVIHSLQSVLVEVEKKFPSMRTFHPGWSDCVNHYWLSAKIQGYSDDDILQAIQEYARKQFSFENSVLDAPFKEELEYSAPMYYQLFALESLQKAVPSLSPAIGILVQCAVVSYSTYRFQDAHLSQERYEKLS